ncbi:MAG: hypothetical protein ACLFR1_09760 [Spirochaetia bacterium]
MKNEKQQATGKADKEHDLPCYGLFSKPPRAGRLLMRTQQLKKYSVIQQVSLS